MDKFQFCDSNIGFFSIAPPLVISSNFAIAKLSLLIHFLYKFCDWFLASFLYCFPYSYRSSNYCNSNSCRSFNLNKTVIFSLSPLRAITLESEPSKKKQKTDTKWMQRGLRVITLQGAIEKSQILLSQYWKNESLDANIIVSYFGGSNNIFANCRYIDN